MTNHEIRAFLEVMQCGSISKAAERLFISQPALSLRIHNLEEELGCKLFIRQKGVRNIELTAHGRQFVQLAERWNGLLGEMQGLHIASSQPYFRVSSLNSVSSTILPQVYLDFLALQPEISLEAEDLSSYASYESIESRHMDLAVIVDQRYSMKAVCHPLFSDRLKLICNADCDLPESVDASQLDPSYYVYSPWFLEFEQWNQLCFGRDFRPRVQVQIMQQMEFFLEQKNCWSIVPASVERLLLKNPNIVPRTFNSDLPTRSVMYLTPPEGEKHNPLTAQFLDCFRQRLLNLEQEGIVQCNIQVGDPA